MLKWIYPQAHKYHILLTFICWQSHLKYRSTISFIITFYGNNRFGAEQRFWLVLQVWSSVHYRHWDSGSQQSSHEQRSQHVAIEFQPNHTHVKVNIAIFLLWYMELVMAVNSCRGDILFSAVSITHCLTETLYYSRPVGPSWPFEFL